MIPILYEKTASNFENNGIGHLRDTVSLKATEERNGSFEITFTYPISGLWYDEIKEGSIVKAKVNETSELQLFRIYKSSKPLKGIVTFYAKHISYDLSGYPIRSLSMASTTAEAALSRGFASSLLPHPFTVWSNITTLNDIEITKPRSLRNLCGGEAGSVLSVWGGEFEFDNFNVKLHAARGQNRDVVVCYGKNLTDAKQERNINDCYTHFYPYAVRTVETRNDAGEFTEYSEEVVTLSDGPIELVNPENIGHQSTLTLDISSEFADGEEINEENLRSHADAYIASHSLGKPKVNITVSFLQIWDSPEYESLAPLERVSLCDTVTVRFTDLGIDAGAKVVKTEYDGLAERYTKIELGDVKGSIADSFVSLEDQVLETTAQIGQTGRAVARLTIKSDELEGRVDALAKWVSDNEEDLQSIASISVMANDNAAAIISLTKWQSETDTNIANIKQTADDAGAAINLVVKNGVVQGSVLIEAINGESKATINADRIDLEGYVTVKSLGAEGTTVIDGSRITTGQIASNNYIANSAGMMIDLDTGAIDSKNFKVKADGSVIVSATLTAKEGSNIAGWTTTGSVFGKAEYSMVGTGNYAMFGINSNNFRISGSDSDYEKVVMAVGLVPGNPMTNWDVAKSASFRLTNFGKIYAQELVLSTVGSVTSSSDNVVTSISPYTLTMSNLSEDRSAILSAGWLFLSDGDATLDISLGSLENNEQPIIQIKNGNGSYTVYLNTSTKTIGVK